MDDHTNFGPSLKPNQLLRHVARTRVGLAGRVKRGFAPCTRLPLLGMGFIQRSHDRSPQGGFLWPAKLRSARNMNEQRRKCMASRKVPQNRSTPTARHSRLSQAAWAWDACDYPPRGWLSKGLYNFKGVAL
ncbi:hypothetical protein HI914_07087 [Erysiphe necator]|nr:hypothetical protein HI914_07087 [Erysiphe necator]